MQESGEGVKEPSLILELKDRGETCPRRGIPLVDVYLSGTGGPRDSAQGLWMQALSVSVPFADVIAAWFVGHGVEVQRGKTLT